MPIRKKAESTEKAYQKRLASALRSALASLHFGHPKPSAKKLAAKFGITLEDAETILATYRLPFSRKPAPKKQQKPAKKFFGAPDREMGQTEKQVTEFLLGLPLRIFSSRSTVKP